ncbi:MAG: alkaline phosphatase family protein [Planctomycetaceae bacterium]|nr:alkaline phosphatase family protein [Planctomycetaceae bacterium]
MKHHAVLLSVPGLRARDVVAMPRLSALSKAGATVPLTPSFPCVTCPVQANMTTGVTPERHGVVANGFFWRDKAEVEMWTAWNDCIQAPQIWELLHKHDPALTSAVWFPLHSKGAKADYICTPAPIHNPDGSESLWCYTKPTELYGELRDSLGHFPLMHFWGPLANIKSTDWIVDSAVVGAKKFHPRFSYIYLPHLDYAAQKFGPNSPQATTALGELDAAIGRLVDGYSAAGIDDVLWLAASEYAILDVNSVGYPNRVLREAGLLTLQADAEGREQLDVAASRAWALVDHQFAHVFVRDPADVPRVAALFENDATVEQVLTGVARDVFHVKHDRSGEVVLIAKPRAWFAYYWWLDDAKAPPYARTVDIHRKPGYDPVELFVEMPARAIPLNATLVKGSHGHPSSAAEAVLVTSDTAALQEAGQNGVRDIDVARIVLANFGVPGAMS